MQAELNQGLRTAKFTRVAVIFVYTIFLTRNGTKRQFQTPPRVDSNLVRQKLFFACVLRYHVSSLKGEGRNLLISNSVAGANLPDIWLDNPNVHRLLIMGHLPTPSLPYNNSLYSYGRNFPKGLMSQQSIRSSNGKLFGGRFGDYLYSASIDNIIMTNHCDNFFKSVPITC